MPNITIGPSFFKKEFNDYRDWHWAIVREFLQNSIDARSKSINIKVKILPSGNTELIVENDGAPMTRGTIVDKLLALGESGKNFDDSVGGFGKAKIILYLAHESYEIRSGGWSVMGCGADYEIEECEFVSGTWNRIVMEGAHAPEIARNVRKFAKLAQWSGELTLEYGDDACREALYCSLLKGSRRRDLDFGVVYTNKSDEYRCVVRMNGIPMFVEGCGVDRMVVVELNGKSDQVLTSNRDGLVYPYSSELSSFITELSVDCNSALRPQETRYEEFAGKPFIADNRERELVEVGDAGDDAVGSGFEMGVDWSNSSDWGTGPSGADWGVSPVQQIMSGVRQRIAAGEGRSRSGVALRDRKVALNMLGSHFVIKNNTGLTIPKYYRPDSSDFSSYAEKLARVWGALLIELYSLTGHSGMFCTGFVFDEENEATFEKYDSSDLYCINPAKIVSQSSSESRSFRKRFKLTERDRLLSIAVHEFLHGAGGGLRFHDERYANSLTHLFADVMRERKRFNWCFRS